MLGDWVEFVSSKNKHHYGIGQIAGINPLEGSVEPTTFNVCKKYEDGKTCLFIGVSRFCVKTVSITPEILEKNGFVHYEEDEDSFRDKDCVFIKQNLGGYGVCLDKNRTVSGLFNYVHELQHALKLCGIEKTIEL